MSLYGFAATLAHAGFLFHCLLTNKEFGLFAGFLIETGRTGEHDASADIHRKQTNAAFGHNKFPYLIGVRHTARFEDVNTSIAFPVKFEVANENPGVDERRDADISLLEIFLHALSE